MEKEHIEKQIEMEQKAQCQKCGESMHEAITYFFPKDSVYRIDVPYFSCQKDQVAKLDMKTLEKLNPGRINEEIINEIKKFLKEKLYYELQE
jgi:hypothetical protein